MIRLENDMLLAFSGDSITDGNRQQRMDCNHIFGHGYQTVIAGRLGADNLDTRPKFLNMGHAGWTASMIFSKWEEEILPFKPSIISILAGINDVIAGWRDQISAEQVSNAYLACCREALERTHEALPGVKCILCEPFFKAAHNHSRPYRNVPHPIHGEDFQLLDFGVSEEQIEFFESALAEMRKGLRALGEEFGCVYVPLQDLFDEAAKKAPVEYFIWDSVHPTLVGHELIARRWLETVGKAIK